MDSYHEIARKKLPLALVATTSHLLLVDLHNKKTTVLQSEHPEYYGISWQPNRPELILSHSGLDTALLKNVETYANSETGYISRGHVKSDPFLSAPHQILCAPDGRLICTNTGRNCITVIDLDQPNFYQEKRLSPSRWDRLSLDSPTGDHINSVFVANNLLYVIIHGHTKGSSLATLTYPTLDVLSIEPVSRRTGLHNIWVTAQGQKLSCHSSKGALVDLDCNQVVWEAGSDIYLRGLAAADDFLVLGESQMTGRDLRKSSTSAVWIVEPTTFKTLDYVYLGPYGAVNDVRLVNIPDHAHHGQTFSGMTTLISQDVATRTRAQRLAAASYLDRSKKQWSGFETVFGSPETLANGEKKAAPEHLCLLIQRSAFERGSRSLSFRYALEKNGGASHVSIIFYKGTGQDTDMKAFLLQASGDDAARLEIWSHEGTEWTCEDAVNSHPLPMSGHLKAEATEDTVTLFIDNQLIGEFGAAACRQWDGRLGMRWMNATIADPN